MENNENVQDSRSEVVAQSNDFIRHPRNQLTPQELNVVYFLISKIKPCDKDFMKISFTVQEFCKVCGIDHENGKNYKNLKSTLKSVADKSALVDTSRGSKMLVRWLETFEIWENTGELTATFSQTIKPYLLGLIDSGFYMQTELINFLALKSKYSKRLYELLKSYLDIRSEKRYRLVSQNFEITELKRLVSAENYVKFKDFRIRVLDVAMREINAVTDVTTGYTATKTGRTITHVSFFIQLKKPIERLEARSSAENMLDNKKRL